MQVFFAPDISGNIHVLDATESKHLIRVLRMSRGGEVKLIDGKGNLYEGQIEDADPKRCSISLSGVKREFEKRNYRLEIAISPLKNPDRFEWFIEKAVEIGIDAITPMICRNTEKPGIRHERINNIIISAMKQSLKAFMPVLHEPVSLSSFLGEEHGGIKMIAHCNKFFERKKITELYHKGSDALILIGPEGDFTEDEIMNAAGKGFSQIHLGSSRLRTETAGISACHSVYLVNQ